MNTKCLSDYGSDSTGQITFLQCTCGTDNNLHEEAQRIFFFFFLNIVIIILKKQVGSAEFVLYVGHSG